MKADDLAQGDVRGAANLMKMLASETRLQILCHLAEGECSVGDLAQVCGTAQPTMSQQLRRLADMGVVARRRDAQTILYRLAKPEVIEILATLRRFYCPS